MSRTPTYLVADIGGTNARFAIASGSAETGFELDEIRRLKNEDFEDLRDAAHAYLESVRSKRPDRACVAVAGPVSDGKIRLTNSTWRFCPEELAADLGFKQLLPVNDFAAQARGAPLTALAERVVLNEAEADPASPLLLVSRARRDRAARRRRCRLLACGSSGEAREALDVLSAADGEGEAARSPSALYTR